MESNKIVFTESAIKDLDSIIDYIVNTLDNPNYANKLLGKISGALDIVAEFPESCPLIENDLMVRKDIRKSIIESYILFYIYDKTNRIVFVLRIVYSKRELSSIVLDM